MAPLPATRSLRPARPGARDVALSLLLAAAVVAAYWPALAGGYLLDDAAHVTRPELRSLQGLWRIWTDIGCTVQYYPVLHSAFWLEHRLWDGATAGYHLVNLAQHLGAALLVVAILRRIQIPGAWLAAWLFALSPVGVESVAWMAEQKNTLSAVFYLGALYVYLGFDQRRSAASYALATVLFLLALLSKSVTATLPPALLIVLWWQRGRLGWRRDVVPLLPWFLLAIAVALLTVWVERTYVGARGPEFALAPAARLLVAGRALWLYVSTLLWPTHLVFVQPRWAVDPAVVGQWLYPLAALGLTAVLVVLARRQRAGLAGWLFFAVALAPGLGLVNVYWFRYTFVADHFQYLACLGLIVPLAAGATTLAHARTGSRGAALALRFAAVGLLAVLGNLTWRQARYYRDPLTFYAAILERNPGCWLAHNNLGEAISRLPGRLEEAIAEYQEALQLKPDYPEAHYNLGCAFAQLPGRLPYAIGHYRAALRVRPRFAEAWNNLGNALAQTPGGRAEAVTVLETAVRLRPDFAAAHNNLGRLLADDPARLGEAIREYELALQLDPALADAHNNLGNILAATPERQATAVAEYEMALRLRPDYPEAHFNLAALLAQIPGRTAEARQHVEAALRLQPDLAPALALRQSLRQPAP